MRKTIKFLFHDLVVRFVDSPTTTLLGVSVVWFVFLINYFTPLSTEVFIGAFGLATSLFLAKDGKRRVRKNPRRLGEAETNKQ